MPDYRQIYDTVVAEDQRYNRAENSPGYRLVVEHAAALSMISGRSLDVGCGVGFAVEFLSGPSFDLITFGVDVSPQAIQLASQRLEKVAGSNQRLSVLEHQALPYEDDFFNLVTCFDVLEHLDPGDIEQTLDEMLRVLRPGGTLLVSVSCRPSGVTDVFGDNLHRTVRSPDWWLERMAPDRAEYDGLRVQLTLWKRLRLTDAGQRRERAEAHSRINATERRPAEMSDSAKLYQQIYDENPWYGDADQGRCPGVRLLPSYRDWLIGPVMDLGCGRGQAVEAMRADGLEADGIDQIKLHPGMRVGDITRPIEGLEKYQSAVCIDCIEHLHDDQVQGLFENMKRVRRQAFSIHNGESTGTGQELHVNRKSFIDWTKLIREHFEIASAIQIHDQQVLYLTQTPEPPVDE